LTAYIFRTTEMINIICTIQLGIVVNISIKSTSATRVFPCKIKLLTTAFKCPHL